MIGLEQALEELNKHGRAWIEQGDECFVLFLEGIAGTDERLAIEMDWSSGSMITTLDCENDRLAEMIMEILPLAAAPMPSSSVN